MNILPLKSDRVSLEFATSEFATVMSGLKSFGLVEREDRATHELVTVAGEQFVLMNEWDEPCLLSQSAPGDDMLRSVCVGARPRPRASRQTGVAAAR